MTGDTKTPRAPAVEQDEASLIQAEHCFAEFLAHLGLFAERDPELVGAPGRVVRLYEHLFEGLRREPPPVSSCPNPGFGERDQEPILILGITFHSMCAHHLLPFFGVVDIAYVPTACIGGVGWFPKVVRHFARMPQVQERLVRQVADHVQQELSPLGVFVRARARQMCLEMDRDNPAGELVCSAAMGALAAGPLRTDVVAMLTGPECD